MPHVMWCTSKLHDTESSQRASWKAFLVHEMGFLNIRLNFYYLIAHLFSIPKLNYTRKCPNQPQFLWISGRFFNQKFWNFCSRISLASAISAEFSFLYLRCSHLLLQEGLQEALHTVRNRAFGFAGSRGFLHSTGPIIHCTVFTVLSVLWFLCNKFSKGPK